MKYYLHKSKEIHVFILPVTSLRNLIPCECEFVVTLSALLTITAHLSRQMEEIREN